MKTDELDPAPISVSEPLDASELVDLEVLLDEVPRAAAAPPELIEPWFARLAAWVRRAAASPPVEPSKSTRHEECDGRKRWARGRSTREWRALPGGDNGSPEPGSGVA